MAPDIKKKVLWAAVVMAAVLVSLVVVLRVTHTSLHDCAVWVAAGLKEAMTFVRSLGPVPFFLAMALLPCVGFPLLAFSIAAAPLFSAEFGLSIVASLVFLSFSVNLALSYWLSRYAMRPFFDRLIRRLGYAPPRLAIEDPIGFTLVMRLTPGPPFFAQSYLLGLMGVPFRIYFFLSAATTGLMSLAIVFFGESLMHGSSGQIIVGVSLVIVVSILIRWLRKRVTKDNASA